MLGRVVELDVAGFGFVDGQVGEGRAGLGGSGWLHGEYDLVGSGFWIWNYIRNRPTHVVRDSRRRI